MMFRTTITSPNCSLLKAWCSIKLWCSHKPCFPSLRWCLGQQLPHQTVASSKPDVQLSYDAATFNEENKIYHLKNHPLLR